MMMEDHRQDKGGNVVGDKSYQFALRITTVQRNYPIGSVDLNRNHSSDVLV